MKIYVNCLDFFLSAEFELEFSGLKMVSFFSILGYPKGNRFLVEYGLNSTSLLSLQKHDVSIFC